MRLSRRNFVLAVGAAASTAASRAAWAQTYPSRRVRIAHQVDFAPFADVKDGQSVGLAVEVVRAAAERVGVDVEFVRVPFEEVQRTLDDGRAVAIFPLAITPERQRLFDFSAPLYSGGGGLFVRAPYATPKDISDLSGKIVVTPRTGPLAAYIERTAPTVKLMVATDYKGPLPPNSMREE
jgi:polar amino acid transport system substrate-binding protein